MLPKLGVSSSGYYSWKNWEKSRQEIRRERVKREIKNIYERSKKVYGAPKIMKELEKIGEKVSLKTVSKYMRDMNLKAIWVKKYRPEKHEEVEKELKNVLSREFSPPEANMVWVTDITYIGVYPKSWTNNLKINFL